VLVVVHGQGHTQWNDCVSGLFERLVRTGSVQGLDGQSCPPVSLPSFRTR
jgi:hypothetical protein